MHRAKTVRQNINRASQGALGWGSHGPSLIWACQGTQRKRTQHINVLLTVVTHWKQ